MEDPRDLTKALRNDAEVGEAVDSYQRAAQVYRRTLRAIGRERDYTVVVASTQSVKVGDAQRG